MMEWLVPGLLALASAPRVGIGFWLIYILASGKLEKKKDIILPVTSAGILAVVLHFTGLSDFFLIVAEAAILAGCIKVLLKTEARKVMFFSIFYYIGVWLWIFLVSLGLGIVFENEAFLNLRSGYGLVAVWVVNAFLFMLGYYVTTHRNMEKKKIFHLASRFAIVSFALVITLKEQTVIQFALEDYVMWIYLSMSLLFGVLVLYMSYQYEMEKELARLKTEAAEMLERDYTALNKTYSANAKLFHDLHNHLGMLRQMLTTEKYEKAVEYLDELQEPIREIADKTWTGDETVDYLINSKVSLATQMDIEMQVRVEFPRHSNVKSADLCTILGNLLDNALDAVQKNEKGQRRIGLTIRRINQMLVIKVENPFSIAPVQKGGELQTIKTDGGMHGWGLKSARTAVEKYDGMVKTTTKGNHFTAVATMSFVGVE